MRGGGQTEEGRSVLTSARLLLLHHLSLLSHLSSRGFKMLILSTLEPRGSGSTSEAYLSWDSCHSIIQQTAEPHSWACNTHRRCINCKHTSTCFHCVGSGAISRKPWSDGLWPVKSCEGKHLRAVGLPGSSTGWGDSTIILCPAALRSLLCSPWFC